MSGSAARVLDRVPWYVKHPGTFFEKRPAGQSFLARVWIVTGWHWASVLLQRRDRRAAS